MKKLILFVLLEELCSEDESGVRSAASEGRRCKVSGIKTIRLVPKAKTAIPNINGIHGDFAIKKEAIVGAISSANMPALFPKRKTLALRQFLAFYKIRFQEPACLFDSVVISQPTAKNIIDATASPPPMKINKGDSQIRRIGRTLQNHITIIPQAPERIKPVNESTKISFLPILYELARL